MIELCVCGGGGGGVEKKGGHLATSGKPYTVSVAKNIRSSGACIYN